MEPNPWEVIGEKYPVGSVIEGKIKNITDFGIFIGIDEGIDGLVHISDISWTKRFKHPSEIYKKGQVIQAKVLYIDKENERFSLSIKDLASNPWQTIDAALSGGCHRVRAHHQHHRLRPLRGSGRGHRRPDPHLRVGPG